MNPATASPLRPDISVVMVTFGAWPLAEQAVAALAAHTNASFELMIVDNASEPETRSWVSQLGHARVTLNETNRGFGPASNQGVEQARGELVLLLNTDCYVHAGWLEPMLEALAGPGVGAVVPRFLNPDGSLQDAGGLIAQDGTVLSYGDGDDPDRLCYRFRRVIDYGAAACMLMRRSTFQEIGGFDARYAMGYYEDADLCLRLAQSGRTVVYEPRATVTHVRYGSGTAHAAAERSEHNRGVFADRWRMNLAGRPRTFRNASRQALIAGRDALASPRLLICAPADEAAAAPLAHTLVRDWPRGRVTWATGAIAGHGSALPDCLACGVEVADDADAEWLNDRRFHYDLVVTGPAPAPWLSAALDSTQPQAARVSLSELTGPASTVSPGAARLLAEAGVAATGRR